MNRVKFTALLALVAATSAALSANEPATAPACASAPAGKTALVVQVEGLSELKGTLRIQLFQGKDNWLKAACSETQMPVTAHAHSWSLSSLAEGEYGLFLYQDLNDNGVMDTNAMGIPKEPYAFSNNARGMFGPAKWEKAGFPVAQTTVEQKIRL